MKLNRSQRYARSQVATCLLFIFCFAVVNPCHSLSIVTPTVKGSAAKPFEKKKVAVFGAGGYLGGCVFGFLQRAASLYGTGIAGIASPRCISATGVGSMSLNGILSKHFILAQADESFIKLTDMTSVSSIQGRVSGFDAAVMATRCTVEQRPVTGGTYEKGPNSKTMEFYMDRPRSSSVKGNENPEYSMQLLKNSLEACREAGVKHVVVVETDAEFDESTPVGDKYVMLLESCGIPYTYIQPAGKLENVRDYTYAKGIQGDLKIDALDSSQLGEGTFTGTVFREDLAALCVQSLLSLDWNSKHMIRLQCTAPATPTELTRPVQQEWCVNSSILASLLSPIV
jgi:hypothetical protein